MEPIRDFKVNICIWHLNVALFIKDTQICDVERPFLYMFTCSQENFMKREGKGKQIWSKCHSVYSVRYLIVIRCSRMVNHFVEWNDRFWNRFCFFIKLSYYIVAAIENRNKDYVSFVACGMCCDIQKVQSITNCQTNLSSFVHTWEWRMLLRQLLYDGKGCMLLLPKALSLQGFRTPNESA